MLFAGFDAITAHAANIASGSVFMARIYIKGADGGAWAFFSAIAFLRLPAYAEARAEFGQRPGGQPKKNGLRAAIFTPQPLARGAFHEQGADRHDRERQ